MDRIMVFSMYDSKAEAYMQPFFAPTEASAVRSLVATMQNRQHDFFRFAEDFQLFVVGTWDQTAGELAPTVLRSVVGCWTLRAAMKAEENAHA